LTLDPRDSLDPRGAAGPALAVIDVAPRAVSRTRRTHLRVLVCDDHEIYRLGLRALIDTVDDMTLVGEATEPGQALTLAYEADPDVVLVGQGMAGGRTLELIRRLAPYDAGVLVLADSAAESDLVEALRAGAKGYLTRRAAPLRLLDGIRAVAQQETALDSAAAGQLVQYLDTVGDGSVAPGRDAVSLTGLLTARQSMVAGLVAEGLSNAEIARRLYLSQATVKSHLTIILRRLNLRDRTQLAILVNRGAIMGSP
jgi:DNA-binding NarL/FixJ family response regulator